MNVKKMIPIIVLIVALAIRLFTTLLGYHGDLNNNISWGKVAYENGLNGFFEGTKLPEKENGEKAWEYSAPNQPPLTIITFAFTRLVWEKLHDFFWYMNLKVMIFPSALIWFWDDYGMTMLVKLPSILADFGIGYLIYRYFRELKKEKIGLILLTVWLFNPVTWYNSAIWGQTDSVVNLLGLMAIMFLIKRDLPKFFIFFTCSFLFKGSLGIFIPLLIFYALTQKHSLKTWVVSGLYALLVIILTTVWFRPNLDIIIWLYNLYVNQFIPGEIGFLSANAFNLWWLVDPGKVYDSTLILGISARIWGILLTLFANILVIYWISNKPDEKRFFSSLVIVSLVSFLFMTRIHERYLYPFFPMATIMLGYAPKYWPYYLVFSITHLLNLYNLFWVPGFESLERLLKISIFTASLSAINIFLFVASLRNLKRVNM